MGERIKNFVKMPNWLVKSLSGLAVTGIIALTSISVTASTRANEAVKGVEENKERIELKADKNVMNRNYDAIKENTESIKDLGKKIDRLIESK